MPGALPRFIPPMLAELGDRPFDSPEHLFEVKWDGIRALAFVEGGGVRLMGRSRSDLTGRYPELAFLAGIEPGAVLDGELVAWKEGRADFYHGLQRIHAKGSHRIRALSRANPVTFVVFDLLYRSHTPLLERPLVERRAELDALLQGLSSPLLVLSDGVVGSGLALFEQIRARELEGLVAKRLSSPYRPGRRTDEWIKLKPRRTMLCAILGYVVESGDLRSLVIGAEEDGRLVPAGRVASGMTATVRAQLLALCRTAERPTPLIDCEGDARWIEPGLFCTVSYLERMEDGLRAPVFLDFFHRP